jgi:hypothetical protein
MKYALIAYNAPSADVRGPIKPSVAEVLQRPGVTGWVRLQPAETATTVTSRSGQTLLTDGPFIDSKEYLGGLIIIEAANLDEALAVATELHGLMSTPGAIEVRPIIEQR